MRTIYKYPLTPGETSTLDLPAGAKILAVGADPQTTLPVLWAEIDNAVEGRDEHTFSVVGTGGYVRDNVTYLGTVTGVSGWMVFHIYELAGEKGLAGGR